MPLLEDNTASFIVRIRREVGNAPGSAGDWRGSIEHVPSGRRAFFRDLGAIVKFMKPHLTDLGIDTASRFWELMSDDAPPPAEAAPPQPAPRARRRSPTRRAPPRS
jgi:hypothetical protein